MVRMCLQRLRSRMTAAENAATSERERARNPGSLWRRDSAGVPTLAVLRVFAVKLLVSRSRRSPDHRISRSFCGPLPASFSQAPTPHKRFVENKSQSAIRPSGDRAVEFFFVCFSAFQSTVISGLFPVSSVRSAEGRYFPAPPPLPPQVHPISPKVTQSTQGPAEGHMVWFGQLLIANC